MAKSKIIKELVNEEITIEKALKRIPHLGDFSIKLFAFYKLSVFDIGLGYRGIGCTYVISFIQFVSSLSFTKFIG